VDLSGKIKRWNMINNYKYSEKDMQEILNSIVILIDTREKSCEHITNFFDKKGIKYIKKALNQADYSFYIPQNEELSIPRDLYFDKEIAIERKGSLEELSGNLSQQRDRFEKELSLYKGKMHLLIENANYQDIYAGNYKTEYNKKSYLASLHSFADRYNLSIMFMPENKCSGLFIFYTFKYFLKNIIN
jgi:ERCC4-type nuclease